MTDLVKMQIRSCHSVLLSTQCLPACREGKAKVPMASKALPVNPTTPSQITSPTSLPCGGPAPATGSPRHFLDPPGTPALSSQAGPPSSLPPTPPSPSMLPGIFHSSVPSSNTWNSTCTQQALDKRLLNGMCPLTELSASTLFPILRRPYPNRQSAPGRPTWQQPLPSILSEHPLDRWGPS